MSNSSQRAPRAEPDQLERPMQHDAGSRYHVSVRRGVHLTASVTRVVQVSAGYSLKELYN